MTQRLKILFAKRLERKFSEVRSENKRLNVSPSFRYILSPSSNFIRNRIVYDFITHKLGSTNSGDDNKICRNVEETLILMFY